MIILFSVFLLTLLVITAIAIIRTPDLFVAVMLAGIFSLLMAAIFFILDAADVALTEAAVGAGISSVLFVSALALTEQNEKSVRPGHWLVVPVVVAGALIVYATFDKPRLGDPEAPVHQHIAPWYLEKTPGTKYHQCKFVFFPKFRLKLCGFVVVPRKCIVVLFVTL